MHWVYLFIAISFEVVGTTALKASEGFQNLIPSIITITAYFISFYCLSITLKVIPVGIAYAIWSGFGMAAITMIGYFVFKQSLSIQEMIGISMIMGGVLILNLLSRSS